MHHVQHQLSSLQLCFGQHMNAPSLRTHVFEERKMNQRWGPHGGPCPLHQVVLTGPRAQQLVSLRHMGMPQPRGHQPFLTGHDHYRRHGVVSGHRIDSGGERLCDEGKPKPEYVGAVKHNFHPERCEKISAGEMEGGVNWWGGRRGGMGRGLGKGNEDELDEKDGEGIVMVKRSG